MLYASAGHRMIQLDVTRVSWTSHEDGTLSCFSKIQTPPSGVYKSLLIKNFSFVFLALESIKWASGFLLFFFSYRSAQLCSPAATTLAQLVLHVLIALKTCINLENVLCHVNALILTVLLFVHHLES